MGSCLVLTNCFRTKELVRTICLSLSIFFIQKHFNTITFPFAYQVFILSRFKPINKMEIIENMDKIKELVNEYGRTVSKRTLRLAYLDLTDNFKEKNEETMTLFHKEMLKVDTYKSKKPVPVEEDLKKYMTIQPNYRPGEITGYYIEPSVFKALGKHQLDMLRFVECALLSKDHALEMLHMITGLGSKLNPELIIKINSVSHNVTNQMTNKLKIAARTTYGFQAGFYLGCFQGNYKELIRLATSAFTFQLLKGIYVYYSDMTIKDFESVLAEEPEMYWNTTDPMSPLEILLTNYIVYFTAFTNHYKPFDFDVDHNLIAKLFLGHVTNKDDFKWKDQITIKKPTEFADEVCQITYDTLTKDTEIKVPLSFTEYLEELKIASGNFEKTAFLLRPQKTIYHAFQGILEPVKSKRAREEQTKSGPSKKKNKSDKNENCVNFLKKFFEQHEKGQHDEAFEFFFKTAPSFQMFPTIMKQVMIDELKPPIKTEVEQTLLGLLQKWKNNLTAELKDNDALVKWWSNDHDSDSDYDPNENADENDE